MCAHSTHCIEYLGDNDSDGKEILQNILLFIWFAVYSTKKDKEGETERRQREKSLNAGESIK